MVFSSNVFLFLFLPLALLIYFAPFNRFKNLTLIFFSVIFYAYGEGSYVILMFFSALMNYFFGIFIENEKLISKKRLCTIAIIVNLGILIFYKYCNFITDSLNSAFDGIFLSSIALSEIHLPLGISFYTFHSLSYIIDVYRGKNKAQEKPSALLLYIIMFPQLIAGPIIRYNSIADQLTNRSVNFEKFSRGIQRFIVGLAKKMLIANPLGYVADRCISDVLSATPSPDIVSALAWIGILCYTLQIYYDFSGYSDMAIGLGKVFGFDFPENFAHPYISRSVREFWRRWHITLSTWFRDYLYIPLGGNRISPFRTSMNLLIVFILCGLWHGASWNFVIWGLFHGCFLALERSYFGKFLEKLWKPLQHAYLLLVVVVAWVFFRMDTLAHSLTYIDKMFSLGDIASFGRIYHFFIGNDAILAFIFGIFFAIPSTALVSSLKRHISYEPVVTIVTAASYSAIFLLSLIYVASGTFNPFIYFRF